MQRLIILLYRLGLALLILPVLLFGFGWMPAEVPRLTIPILCFTLATTVLIEYVPVLYKYFKWLLEVKNPVLKWALGIGSSVGGLLIVLISTRQASDIINVLTHEDPSKFLVARSLLSFVTGSITATTILAIMLITAAFCYAISLNGAGLISTFGGSKWIIKVKISQVLGRMIGSISIAFFLLLILIYSPSIFDYAPNIMVMAEYNRASPCLNQKENELVAFIGDGYVSVAAPTANGSYTFETRKCERKDR